MSAEVVVVVKDQDSGIVPGALAIKMRRGKSADACADHDQVISLAGRFGIGRGRLKFVVTKFVREGEGAIMVSPHPHQRRGIVVRSFLGRECRRIQCTGQVRRRQNAAHADGDAVEEIAACNRATHAQFAVVIGLVGHAAVFLRVTSCPSWLMNYSHGNYSKDVQIAEEQQVPPLRFAPVGMTVCLNVVTVAPDKP